MHRVIQIRATLDRVALWAIALTLAGATVGIRLEESEELSIQSAMQIAEAFGRAIEARSGLSPVIDDPVWGVCRATDRCLTEVRARTGARDIVLLKLFGAPKKVRLIAQRFPLGAPPDARFEINVPIEREAWAAPLEEAARAMFAAGLKEPPKLAAQSPQVTAQEHPPPIKSSEGSIAPWVLLGAGATALVVGSVFGASSRSARSAVEGEPHTDGEVEVLTDRLKRHGWTANVLFTVSVLSAGGGLALLFLE
jgi:hypothetical protein